MAELIILLLLAGICIVLGGMLETQNGFSQKILNKVASFSTSNVSLSEKEIVDVCKNLGLRDTASCLVTNVRPWFKYVETEDSKNYNLDELKAYGGDCNDYAKLYERLGREEGYYAISPIMGIDQDTEHRVAVISNSEGYCFIDQLTISCAQIGKSPTGKGIVK